MEGEKVYMVSITQIQMVRPFLKIFARNLKGKDTNEFKKLKLMFNSASENELNEEDICIVKMNSMRYERCQILNILDGQAFIYLIDCALTGNVSLRQVRMNGFIENSI